MEKRFRLFALQEAKQVIETERECVVRNVGHLCNRDCAACDLLLEDKMIIGAYDYVLQLLDSEIAKED